MEFTIRYTMDGVNYSKVVNGDSEMEARASFTNEMKQQKYVITAVESLRSKKESKEDKTTKEKMDDDEDAAEEEKDSVSKK